MTYSDFSHINMTTACFASIDLSKTKWVVAITAPHLDDVKIHTLKGFDTDGLLEIFSNTLANARAQSCESATLTCCYESGYDGFWLQRLLASKGIQTVVLDPASFLVKRRARQPKTDRIDAKAMTRLLKAYAGGDHTVCREIRIPSPEEEDVKRLHRERNQLVRERTQHVSRLRALLALHGINKINPMAASAREAVQTITTPEGRTICPHALAEINRLFDRLQHTQTLIKQVEQERDARVQTPAMPGLEKAKQLARLSGIGNHSATVLANELFHRSFKNRKHLAAYVGLAPSAYASGDVEHNQGISKTGNRQARTLSIELAWCWLRYQPDSALTRWYQQYTKEQTGTPRKVAIVALARKLIIALWRYVETGLIPTGAVVKPAA